jgi:hypothetical protein
MVLRVVMTTSFNSRVRYCSISHFTTSSHHLSLQDDDNNNNNNEQQNDNDDQSKKRKFDRVAGVVGLPNDVTHVVARFPDTVKVGCFFTYC